jgi:hypothetical protein
MLILEHYMPILGGDFAPVLSKMPTDYDLVCSVYCFVASRLQYHSPYYVRGNLRCICGYFPC